MKNMQRILLIFTFVLLHSLSIAEEQIVPIFINTLVEETLRKNPELKYYQAELDMAQARKRDSTKLANPRSSIQLGRWDPSGSSAGLVWQASVAQTFEWPGRLALRKALADAEIDTATLGISSFRDSLRAKVRGTALRMLLQQERQAAANDAVQRVKSVIEVLVQRDATGPSPLLEMNILKANMLSLATQEHQAELEMIRLRGELNLLRSARPNTPLRIASVNVTLPKAPDLKALIQSADQNNFALRIRRSELRQQGISVNLVRNERGPAISVEPYVGSQSAGINREVTVGLGISLPLPLWDKNEGREAVADAMKRQAESTVVATVRDMEKQISEHHSCYKAGLKLLSIWNDQSLNDFKDASLKADEHYKLGAITISTYVETMSSYLEALNNISDAKVEALDHIYILENLCGISLQ